MKSAEPMVLLPYSQLEELLNASKQISLLLQRIVRIEAQQVALKGQFFELLERFRQLQESI